MIGVVCASLLLTSVADPQPRTEPNMLLFPEGRRLMVIMIDGLPSSALQRAFRAGAMPRLTTLLETRPSAELYAYSTFPSATSPFVQEMISGRFSTLADLPVPAAVHAFDRERRRVVRSVTSPEAWQWPVPDLFDAAATSGLEVASVFEAAWDGPQRLIHTRGAIMADAALDMIGVSEFDGDTGPVRELIAAIKSDYPPQVIFLVMNAWDLNAHFHGPNSKEAQQSLSEIDALLGDVFNTLDDLSLLDDTSILLTADHGMVESGKHVNLVSFFEAQGHVAYDASTLGHVLFRERLGEWWTRWPDAILVSGGSNVTQVYLRRENGSWTEEAPPASEGEARRAHLRPDVDDTAKQIAKIEGVSQVLYALDDETVEVVDDTSSARVIGREDGRVAYVVPPNAKRDPFRYLGDANVEPVVCRKLRESCFLDRDQWLLRTKDARYPGAPPLVLQGFHQQRFTGDLIVTAKPGFTFLATQRGDHGNFEREAMVVPFLLNGPGVVEDCVPPRPVRLVDVFPTAAVLLGAAPHDPAFATLDGRALPCVYGP
jgi:hypothetical protein